MGILVAYHPHDPHINSLSYLPSKPDHKGERAGQGFLVSLETLTQLAQKPPGQFLIFEHYSIYHDHYYHQGVYSYNLISIFYSILDNNET